MKTNPLGQRFTPFTLIKFTLPTIIMMVFMSMYTMVDGVFVSNLIGEAALSAINIVYPAVSLVMAVAIMLATGGSAVIATKMGENNYTKARESFSLLIYLGIGIGIGMIIFTLIFMEPILKALGATQGLYPYCLPYFKMLSYFIPMSILQMIFQFFFVTAGKPALGLFSTVAGGITNIILDYIFIAVLDMGISGAALATGIGYSIPAIVGLIYFTVNRKGSLFFVLPKWDGATVLQSCLNGSSEMVTNLSGAVITFLFNIIALKLLGESGVAAVTIVLYSQFLLTAVYLGFSSGVAPILGYTYGEENRRELKKVLKYSIIFIIISSVAIFIFAMIFSSSIASIFTKRGSEVFVITQTALKLFSISFLFCGFNIFTSALFTSLSNGKVSATVSFLRTFVFIIISVFALPLLIGINGIWLAIPLAEIISVFVSLYYIFALKDQYGYL